MQYTISHLIIERACHNSTYSCTLEETSSVMYIYGVAVFRILLSIMFCSGKNNLAAFSDSSLVVLPDVTTEYNNLVIRFFPLVATRRMASQPKFSKLTLKISIMTNVINILAYSIVVLSQVVPFGAVPPRPIAP